MGIFICADCGKQIRLIDVRDHDKYCECKKHQLKNSENSSKPTQIDTSKKEDDI